MNPNEAARSLYQSRRMQTPEEIEKFEEALEQLSTMKTPFALDSLFAAFDDTTQHPEVMWGLVHAVEAYELEPGLQKMAHAIPGMLPHAKDWVRALHYGVLNDKEARTVYRRVIAGLPEETRSVVEQELKELGTSEPEFSSRIQEMLEK